MKFGICWVPRVPTLSVSSDLCSGRKQRCFAREVGGWTWQLNACASLSVLIATIARVSCFLVYKKSLLTFSHRSLPLESNADRSRGHPGSTPQGQIAGEEEPAGLSVFLALWQEGGGLRSRPVSSPRKQRQRSVALSGEVKNAHAAFSPSFCSLFSREGE